MVSGARAAVDAGVHRGAVVATGSAVTVARAKTESDNPSLNAAARGRRRVTSVAVANVASAAKTRAISSRRAVASVASEAKTRAISGHHAVASAASAAKTRTISSRQGEMIALSSNAHVAVDEAVVNLRVPRGRPQAKRRPRRPKRQSRSKLRLRNFSQPDKRGRRCAR